MDAISILLFFVYFWGFGFTALKLVGAKEGDFLESNFMRIGLGMGVFPILAVLLNLLTIPLDWKIFLVLCLIYPVYSAVNAIRKKEPLIGEKINFKNIHILILLLIFAAALFMYASGAFNYPYLEDDDPWSYGDAVKYISVEKNLNDGNNLFKFLDPYPPAYASIMGVMHQVTSSLSWTLKFFNALIISLGLVFFYFFAEKFTKDRNKALFATFVLAVLPCFYTHFIWSISLAMPLLFVMLYCLEKTDEDKKWAFPVVFSTAGFLLTHPSMMLTGMFLVAVYFMVKCLVCRKFMKNELLGILGGALLSLLWWFSNLKDFFLERAESTETVSGEMINESASAIAKIWFYLADKVFPSTSGTATRAYTFSDFFVAKGQGLINVQIGFGIMASILLFLGIAYLIKNHKLFLKKENYFMAVIFAWFVFTFLNVNSVALNLPGFLSFRTWLFLSIPVALLCSLGFSMLIDAGKKAEIPTIIILAVVVFGLIFTSGMQKYELNTSLWPPGGGWTSMEEVNVYTWLPENLEPNTKVFSYNTDDTMAIGFDMYSEWWDEDVMRFRETLLEKDTDELFEWLHSRGYRFLIVSGMSYKYLRIKFGQNETDAKIAEVMEGMLAKPDKFAAVQTVENGGFVFRVF